MRYSPYDTKVGITFSSSVIQTGSASGANCIRRISWRSQSKSLGVSRERGYSGTLFTRRAAGTETAVVARRTRARRGWTDFMVCDKL